MQKEFDCVCVCWLCYHTTKYTQNEEDERKKKKESKRTIEIKVGVRRRAITKLSKQQNNNREIDCLKEVRRSKKTFRD